MGRLAIIAGHTLLGTPFAANARRVEVQTPHGPVPVLDGGSFVYVQRHGFDDYLAPHAIDHGANLTALAEAGCDRVLALSSAGSTTTEIPVGTSTRCALAAKAVSRSVCPAATASLPMARA